MTLLCVVGLASCSKDDNSENPADAFPDVLIGRWETTNIVFDYSFYDPEGSDVQITGWKNKTDAPQYMVLRDDGTFAMKRKNRTIEGTWKYEDVHSGLYVGYMEFDYSGGFLDFHLLSYSEKTMRAVCNVEVDAGVVPEYEEGMTVPLATLTMSKM